MARQTQCRYWWIDNHHFIITAVFLPLLVVLGGTGGCFLHPFRPVFGVRFGQIFQHIVEEGRNSRPLHWRHKRNLTAIAVAAVAVVIAAIGCCCSLESVIVDPVVRSIGHGVCVQCLATVVVDEGCWAAEQPAKRRSIRTSCRILEDPLTCFEVGYLCDSLYLSGLVRETRAGAGRVVAGKKRGNAPTNVLIQTNDDSFCKPGGGLGGGSGHLLSAWRGLLGSILDMDCLSLLMGDHLDRSRPSEADKL